jgi:hypothetical protein
MLSCIWLTVFRNPNLGPRGSDLIGDCPSNQRSQMDSNTFPAVVRLSSAR